jgi:hypothetical protein
MIYIGIKTTYDMFKDKKILIFNIKDFIFHKFICKMYILADEIVEYQDLYRNKDDFRKKF